MPGTSIPGNILSTYDVGFFPSVSAVHHEDYTDVLTILDSYQTPFFSGAPKTRARDVVHSWSVDTLTAASSATAVEGSEHSGDALTKPVRLFNINQIFRRDVTVADREREANPAGIRDMYEHQIMKEFKVLARNVEYTVFRNQSGTSASGDEDTDGSRMAGLRGTFGHTGGITLSGGAGNIFLTADMLRLSMSMYQNGSEPDSIWFSPPTKLQFVEAVMGTAINVRNIAATDQRLVANVDVFETPFNQLYSVVTDRFIPMGTVSSSAYGFYIGDRSMAKLAFYRPPQHKEMGKTGDNTKGIVLMELTLEMTHPSAWGAVTGITGLAGLVT